MLHRTITVFILFLLLLNGHAQDVTTSIPGREEEPPGESKPNPPVEKPTPRAGEGSGRALLPDELMNCDFERGTYYEPECRLRQREDDERNWIRGSGPTPSQSTGPSKDHTKGNTDGFYMFIETSQPTKTNDAARLETGFLLEGPACISLWYHMYGVTIGKLRFYQQYAMSGALRDTELWSKNGNQGDTWQTVSVSASYPGAPYRVIIEATAGSSYYGDIAIDDVIIRRGTCSTVNPEQTTCLYGTVPNTEPKLCVDPCTNMQCDSGSTCITLEIPGTKTRYPKCINPSVDCVQPMNTGDAGCSRNTPRFYYSTTSKSCQQFTYSGCGGNNNNFMDREACDVICRGAPFQKPAHQCKVQHSPQACGQLYNGRYFYNTETHRCEVIGYRCVENPNLNVWANAATCSENCRGAECTLQLATGVEDCGLPTQQYFYNSSAISCQRFNYYGCLGNENRFSSLEVCETTCIGVRRVTCDSTDACQSTCVYGYKMNEQGCRTCECLANPCLTKTCGTNQKCQVAPVSSCTGPKPCPPKAVCTLPTNICSQEKMTGSCSQALKRWYYNTATKICEEMTYSGCQGNSNRFLTRAACNNFCGGGSSTEVCKLEPNPGYECATPPSIKYAYNSFKKECEELRYLGCGGNTNRFDTTAACLAQCGGGIGERTLMTCSFDTDCPQIQQKTDDDFNWSFTSGGTPSSGTGPSKDHTTGSGRYIFIESSDPVKNGHRAVLSTSVFPLQTVASLRTSRVACLTFWYSMLGATIGSLSVYQIDGSIRKQVWQKQGPQEGEWVQARVSLTVSSSSLQVEFEAIDGDGYLGDIALDDVELKEGMTCEGGPRPTVPPNEKITVMQCDFENPCTQLVNATDDKRDWFNHRGHTISSGTGPSADHTKGNADGYYTYFETSSPVVVGDTAKLVANQLPNPNGASHGCVDFWYHMNGENMGRLAVMLNNGDIWSKSGDQGNQWINGKASIALNGAPSFSVAFVATAGGGYKSDIAIDDVTISTGQMCDAVVTTSPPAQSIDCNFDQNICGWTQQQGRDTQDWQRRYGFTGTVGTGPSSDNSGSGYYMVLLGSQGNMQSWARLISTVLQAPAGVNEMCFNFWYHMYGVNVERLEVVVMDTLGTTQLRTIWRNAGNQGNLWQQARIQLLLNGNAGSGVRIAFDAYNSNGPLADIAVDDVTLEPSPCYDMAVCNDAATRSARLANCAQSYLEKVNQVSTDSAFLCRETANFMMTCAKTYLEGCSELRSQVESVMNELTATLKRQIQTSCGENALEIPVKLYPLSCNFDQGFCFLKQSASPADNGDWQHLEGAAQATGPSSAVNGRGWYIGIPFTSVGASTATLESIEFDSQKTGDSLCVSFNYYMTTSGSSSLSMRGRRAGSSQQPSPIWSVTGYQGTSWKYVSMTVELTGFLGTGRPVKYHFLFTADKGNSNGFIGLDELTIKPNTRCSESPQTTPSSSTRVTITDCDFSYGIEYCKLQQVVGSDQFDWTMHRGGTPSVGTGPSGDHTPGQSGQGYFMYLEASYGDTGNTASLQTEQFVAESTYGCVSLWYHMYGTNMGTLNVKIERTGYPAVNVASITGDKGNSWNLLESTYRNFLVGTSYRLLIEAQRGSSYLSDIAIDDVKLIIGATCEGAPPETTTAPPGVWTLPYSCSFESIPGREDVFCGLTQGINNLHDQLDWIRAAGSTPTPYTGPTADHTLNTNAGHYMYMRSSGTQLGHMAYLTTPLFDFPSTSSACLILFAYMYGSRVGTLEVHMLQYYNSAAEAPGSISTVYRDTGDKGQSWIRIEISLQKRPAMNKFSARLVARSEGQAEGDIAIDDVSIRPGQCLGRSGEPSLSKSDTRAPVGRKVFECDFEVAEASNPYACSMYDQDPGSDALSWKRSQEYTQSGGTGPEGDHTKGEKQNGYFMYTEASQNPSKTFRWRTKPITASSTMYCLDFWYHMRGRALGSLTVKVSSTSENSVWTDSVPQVQELNQPWMNQKVTFSVSGPSFRVIFDVRTLPESVSDYWSSDIAIDDLTLYEGGCDQSRYRAKDTGAGGATTIKPGKP